MSVELHHRFDGPDDAPVLVLGSSLGADLGMWDITMPALTDRFRVLRYEHRGHGRSPAPAGPYTIDDLGADVLALVDGLGIERFSIGGVSLGGMTAMWVASEVPDRIERLAPCCTTAMFGQREMWDERAADARRAGTASLADATLERWLSPDTRAERPDDERRLRAMLAAVDDEAYACCCEAIRDMDLRDRLPRITAPTLIIAGEDDPSTPPDVHLETMAGIHGARIEVLDRARHIANVDRPEPFNRVLVAHLTS